MLKTILAVVGLIQCIGSLYKFCCYHACKRGIFKVQSFDTSKLKSQSRSQVVSEVEEIAKVGMTGYTCRPHLHFRVFIFTGSKISIDFDMVSVQDFIS
jgi:hypothetical protein